MLDSLLRHGTVRNASSLQLRPYQREAIAATVGAFAGGCDSALLVLPTGAGKTIVFGSLAHQELPARTLILAHRDELLTQARDKIASITGFQPGLEKGRIRASATDPIVVASVQSLMRGRFIAGPRFGLCVVDEAHHAAAASYRAVLSRLRPKHVLGVTATPFRTDRLELSSVFKHCVYKKTLLDLINEGYLTDIKVRTLPVEIDLSKVKIKQGDYSEGDLGEALEPAIQRLAKLIAREYRHRKLLTFCPLRETSRHWTEALRAQGLPAAHVDGDCGDRKEILESFANNKVRFLSNASLLTEGYDEPSIDTVLILRPTTSRTLFSQMVGRGTRLFPGKRHLLVLDPLFQAERNNPVGIGDLVAETEGEAKIIEATMRKKKSKLITAAKLREQASQSMGLLKAMGAASGRPGYEKALSELLSPQGQQLSVVGKSGLPAALKAFANDIADLFSAKKKDGKGSSPKTTAGPAQKRHIR